MKLLLVIVSVIAVFTADGWDFRNEPGVQNTSGESHLTPGENGDQEEANDILDDPSDNNLAVEGQILPDGPEDRRIKKEKNQNQREVKKSNCKSKIICDIVGGHCVNNPKHCSGRLVPNACKGKCQCCIPGTLEAKLDNLEDEFQNLKSYVNTSSLNMNSDLESLAFNLNTSNLNVSSEIQTLKDYVDQSNSILNLTLQSSETSFNNSLSELNSELQVLKENVNSSVTNLNLTLHSLVGCQEGFYKSNSSRKCYKTYRDKSISWSEAQTKCQEEGLILARTSNEDAIALRKIILDKEGKGRIWLNAIGDGSTFKWYNDGSVLSSNNTAWASGSPGSRVSTSDCLTLQVYEGDAWKKQPYITSACETSHNSISRYPLCEEYY